MAEISQLFDFSRWQPSAIVDLFGRIWTTYEWYMVIFITVQNFAVIDVVSIIHVLKCEYLVHLA